MRAASGAAGAQEACSDLHSCLAGLASETAQILGDEARHADERLRVSFRPAFTKPSNVARIYCGGLSTRLRNILHERVEEVRNNFHLNFDVRTADRGRPVPPEVTMIWTRRGTETITLDVQITLAEDGLRRRSASVPASALSDDERDCLFDFRGGEERIETLDAVVLRAEPSYRPEAEIKELPPGEKLRVIGRIEAAGRENEDWSVVAWTDPVLNERRNVFVKGLGPLVEAARADDEAYADARRADTVSAYNAYLSARPSGRHAAEAQRRRNAAAARERETGREFRDCEECPRMVVVPAGEFEMGSPPSEEGRFDGEEEPVHRVRIGAPFAIGIHEVTRGEFARFVSATDRKTGNSCLSRDGEGFVERPGATWRNPGFGQTDDHPVVCVSWDDAVAYAGWLSGETGHEYRLPSESEWEYAARAGTRTAHWWGEDASRQCAHANGAAGETSVDWRHEGCEDKHVRTAPVGSFPANGWKLRDMLGNVWEWTRDCWNEDYAAAPSDGSAREAGDCRSRVFRGGSWNSEPRYLRAAIRGASAIRRANASEVRLDDAGFRVVRAFAP